jgi:hypothetical protein
LKCSLNQFDLWGVVDGTNLNLRVANLVIQATRKSRDLKAYFNLIFHCGGHQIQLPEAFKTSQEI